jgi:hypothetical protein
MESVPIEDIEEYVIVECADSRAYQWLYWGMGSLQVERMGIGAGRGDTDLCFHVSCG